MTLHTYLNVWLQTYIDTKKAANTGKSYRSAIKHLSPGILAAELENIGAIDLQREVNTLEASYPRQAQILYTVLSAALKRAVKLRYIQANPVELMDKPAHKAREAEYLHPAEALAYVREAEKKAAGPLLILMITIGLRRNEARGLQNGDLDAEGILHIRRQRTRDGVSGLKSSASRRDLPLPDNLRTFFSGPAGEWVVDVSEKSLRTQHRSVLRAIGIDRCVTLHGLRHTCATLAITNDIPLAQVSKMLGHAHFQLTVDLYTHADTKIMGRCTRVINNYFFPSYIGKGARLEIV